MLPGSRCALRLAKLVAFQTVRAAQHLVAQIHKACLKASPYQDRVGLAIRANALPHHLVMQGDSSFALPVEDAGLHQAGVDLRSPVGSYLEGIRYDTMQYNIQLVALIDAIRTQ